MIVAVYAMIFNRFKSEILLSSVQVLEKIGSELQNVLYSDGARSLRKNPRTATAINAMQGL